MKLYKYTFLLIVLLAGYVSAYAQNNNANDDILITTNAAIVNNLVPIGKIEVTKTAFMGTKDNLTHKAELELKQQAEAKGGNIVYVTTSDYINDPNSYFKKVHVMASLYKGDVAKLTQQAAADVAKNGLSGTHGLDGMDFKIVGCRGDKASQSVTLYFVVTNVSLPDMKLRLMNGWNSSPVAANDINMNQFKCKSMSLGNLTKTDKVQSEIASGLKLKGSIVLSNVLPTTAQLYHVSIPAGIAPWDGEDPDAGLVRVQMSKYGTFEGNNIPIDWSGQTMPDAVDTAKTASDNDQPNQIKNIDNNIDFIITGCTGNPNSQRVTVSFVFSNPRKVNQRITLFPASNALDDFSASFPAAVINLATENAQGNNLSKELPYGLQLKGSITFANILPTVGRLALVNIQTTSSNWDGGNDQHEGVIEVRNVKINWITPKPNRKLN